MDSRNPSKMPRMSSRLKREKETTSLEKLTRRMTNDSDDSILLNHSKNKADDPKPDSGRLCVTITWFNLILDNK